MSLLLLVGRFVRTKVICVCNKDKPFDDQCRHAFGLKQSVIFSGPVIALGLTGKSLSSVKWTIYSEAKHQFSARNRDVLMNAQSPLKWWSTLDPAYLTIFFHTFASGWGKTLHR